MAASPRSAPSHRRGDARLKHRSSIFTALSAYRLSRAYGRVGQTSNGFALQSESPNEISYGGQLALRQVAPKRIQRSPRLGEGSRSAYAYFYLNRLIRTWFRLLQPASSPRRSAAEASIRRPPASAIACIHRRDHAYLALPFKQRVCRRSPAPATRQHPLLPTSQHILRVRQHLRPAVVITFSRASVRDGQTSPVVALAGAGAAAPLR